MACLLCNGHHVNGACDENLLPTFRTSHPLTSSGGEADVTRMSVPPPSSPPPPPETASAWPEPNRRRALQQLAGVVVVIAALLALSSWPSGTPEACIVNGFGNELCGDSAIAYCEMLDGQVGYPGDACVSLLDADGGYK